jgi:NAD(P)-dependent dehydrogenase (short-subunit alcohol dehydrogenase family)
MSRFEGKGCIVAGGASGIGAKAAERFAEEGGRVLIGDVNPEMGEALANKIGAGKAVFQQLDVTSPESCRAAVERTVSEFGGLDCVVNCAIKMDPGPLADLSLESWKRVLDVGLNGTFLMCREAARAMSAQGRGGAIVNLSSNGGLAPYPGTGAYSTCKAGVIMLTKQASLEWASHGIRVNAICPAHVETPLTAYLQDPEIRKGREAVTPLGRVGQPEDVAAGILYLASEEASWVTGTALVIDGGVTHSIFNHMPGRKWK